MSIPRGRLLNPGVEQLCTQSSTCVAVTESSTADAFGAHRANGFFAAPTTASAQTASFGARRIIGSLKCRNDLRCSNSASNSARAPFKPDSTPIFSSLSAFTMSGRSSTLCRQRPQQIHETLGAFLTSITFDRSSLPNRLNDSVIVYYILGHILMLSPNIVQPHASTRDVHRTRSQRRDPQSVVLQIVDVARIVLLSNLADSLGVLGR